jgi:hypothetical protein
MQLIHLLQSLQAIAETRPNTTIRLEGVELANGQRGNVEIQRPRDDHQAVGLNIRVSNENGEDAAEMAIPNGTFTPPTNGNRNRSRRGHISASARQREAHQQATALSQGSGSRVGTDPEPARESHDVENP